MRTKRTTVDLAKQIVKQKLKLLNGTGTATGNFEIYNIIAKDVQNALYSEDCSLSEDELRGLVLDAMMETGHYQVGDISQQVRWFRVLQVVLTLTLALALLTMIGLSSIIRLVRENDTFNLHIILYFGMAIVSLGLLCATIGINKLIKSFKRKNIIGR